MALMTPMEERPCTIRYRRCRFPVDNPFSPGDKVMAAVPGGVVFISRRGHVYPGERMLMFCDYESSPSRAVDLFGHQLQCSEVFSISFTGSMLVVVAEGGLDSPEDGFYDDRKDVWCYLWSDLRKRNVVPIHLLDIPCGAHYWGSLAGASHKCAFACDGTLTTMSGNNFITFGHERFHTKIPFEETPIIAVAAASPQITAIAGGRKLAAAPFDTAAQLQDNMARLLMPPSCLAISDNGQMIAVGYRTGLLEIWDSRDLTKPTISIMDFDKACSSVAFSGPSCDRLFAASEDTGEILVVDTRHFTGHYKLWLPVIPRPSETLSRYDLRSALWPDSKDWYELPTSKPESYISTLAVSSMVWIGGNDGILAVGTNEGILFLQCGYRVPLKSLEFM